MLEVKGIREHEIERKKYENEVLEECCKKFDSIISMYQNVIKRTGKVVLEAVNLDGCYWNGEAVGLHWKLQNDKMFGFFKQICQKNGYIINRQAVEDKTWRSFIGLGPKER